MGTNGVRAMKRQKLDAIRDSIADTMDESDAGSHERIAVELTRQQWAMVSSALAYYAASADPEAHETTEQLCPAYQPRHDKRSAVCVESIANPLHCTWCRRRMR